MIHFTILWYFREGTKQIICWTAWVMTDKCSTFLSSLGVVEHHLYKFSTLLRALLLRIWLRCCHTKNFNGRFLDGPPQLTDLLARSTNENHNLGIVAHRPGTLQDNGLIITQSYYFNISTNGDDKLETMVSMPRSRIRNGDVISPLKDLEAK